MRGIIASVCIIVIVSTSSAFAVPVIDQQYYDTYVSMAAETRNDVERAQTFTAGLSGTLTRIDFASFRRNTTTGDLIFSIRPTDGGLPVSSSGDLLHLVLKANELPSSGILSIDLTPAGGVQIVSGQVLAIILTSPQTSWDYSFGGGQWRFPPTYTRGNLYYKTTGSNAWVDEGDLDLYFTTYVEPVPEPPSVLILCCGLIGTGTAFYRRRRSGS